MYSDVFRKDVEGGKKKKEKEEKCGYCRKEEKSVEMKIQEQL